jgi:hypothetical protein
LSLSNSFHYVPRPVAGSPKGLVVFAGPAKVAGPALAAILFCSARAETCGSSLQMFWHGRL